MTMDLLGEFILPTDVTVVPIMTLPDQTRASFDHRRDDWAVTRLRSRTPTRVIDADLAALLLLFRGGRTIVQAIIAFCGASDLDPDRVLEDALPSLRRFIETSWLTPIDSPAAHPISASRRADSAIGRYRLVECVNLTEDTEVYRAVSGDHGPVAVKLVRLAPDPQTEARMRAEANTLRAIAGHPAPVLWEAGVDDGQQFLAMEWCDGVPASIRGAALRRDRSPRGSARLHGLCVEILEAYDTLHKRGVIHGDVHPGNILIDEADLVRIIDFGMSSSPGFDEPVPRGGVPSFFDPQSAADQLAGDRVRAADHLSEQYALGALLYLLVTGHPYVNFSAERSAMLREIIEEPPVPFSHVTTVSAPHLEATLRRALSKRPEHRYPDVSAFLDDLRTPESPVTPRARDGYVDGYVASLGRSPAEDGSGPRATVMFGYAGISYGLYRMAVVRDDAELLAQADYWAVRAAACVDSADAIYDTSLDITEASVGCVSPYHTESGTHAVTAIIGRAMGDFVAVRTGVEGFLSTVDRPVTSVDLTLGRSSVLIGSLLVLDALNGLPPTVGFDDLTGRVRELGDRTMAAVWTDPARDHPVGVADDLRYLGMAHGWAGVCYAALAWCATTGAALPASLPARLAELARRATPASVGFRWPIQADPHGPHTYMNSWCNGAPGYVFLWHAAAGRLDDPHYAALAEGAAQQTWQQRDAIAGICCGYAGRAYALLNHYRHTKEPIWLDRARTLAELARQASTPQMRRSLYKGELGVAVLAAELEDPLRARLPFFEREAS